MSTGESYDRYLNFPIELLQGFMIDSKKCLVDIANYGSYAHCLKLGYGNELSKQKATYEYFDFEFKKANACKSFELGEQLYNSIEKNTPMAGISMTMFGDYYKNKKTPFEKACLLAYLAFKSIIGDKQYIRMTNIFLISRMAGNRNKDDDLPQELIPYTGDNGRRRLIAIKNELQMKFGLVYYGQHTRGFYVSFKMELEDLILQAEKDKKKTKLKALKDEQKEAYRRAINRLNNLPNE